MPRAPPHVPRARTASCPTRCLAEFACSDHEAFFLLKESNMCTRANRRSVPDSLHALVGTLVAFASALFVLVMAIVTFPVRLVRPGPTKHGRPASTEHVEVQVHLGNRERVGAIEHSCRAALKRAARTWAPYPLPLDRVEVLSSAPPLGKVDIYERWMAE